MFRIVMSTLAACILCAGNVSADQLASKWTVPRATYKNMSQDACNGDETAFKQLFNDALVEGHPVALNSLAWMIGPSQKCAFVHHDREDWVSLLRRSAEAGYPVAMKNYGNLLLQGEKVQRNIPQGLKLLQAAENKGHATAAVALASIFADELYGFDQNWNVAKRHARRALKLGAKGTARTRMRQILREIERCSLLAPC